MRVKNAVFSCLGIGDGLLALVLSNNLRRSGQEVVTFHPQLKGLQRWFPHTPVEPFPELETLAEFDRYFIFYEKTPWMQAVLEWCVKEYPHKTVVLNPIATKNQDYPYWENGCFDGRKPLAKNLSFFCKTVLRMSDATQSCGITIPKEYEPHRFLSRVVIHPTSSKEEKNWPKEKFLRLADELRVRGFEPLFTLSPQERGLWPEVNAPLFSTLDSLAAAVCESGFFIGNDSGVGHLASACGLPTVTLCPTRRTGQFWRPSWAPGSVLYPPSWVPNLKGLRWRDRYWKNLISVNRVLNECDRAVNRRMGSL